MTLAPLLAEIAACRICADALPHQPRPVVRAGAAARLLLVGQAPGRRVHESGVPWDDPSGRRLREWLDLDPADFYDPEQVALVPMGFCFPGSARSGDLPPRPECAPTWHPPLLAAMPDVGLRVLIGRHAVGRYWSGAQRALAEAVGAAAEADGDTLVLPHPSPRNQRWLAQHPWFVAEVLPLVRRRVHAALAHS
ncbi:uracil-DNA glycosylase family protein [Nocardioides panacisoli]|uniref:uracil-DNA glycosylase family protein n=1 Tax=Nocardioides panacisoli TaxID=627624 RepID=UPI001C626758|nr:uracil-DNA glycosylase family protein [Nocardioides panacisoli]QYJ02788.1 uracil-DNA glycosylase family protein [Nocardioides panacisoli]